MDRLTDGPAVGGFCDGDDGARAGVGARLASNQLLPRDFHGGDDIGGKQRHLTMRRDDFVADFRKGADRRVLDPDLLDVKLTAAKAEQLVEILLVARIFRVGLGGKIWPSQHAAILHRNCLLNARDIALCAKGIGGRGRGQLHRLWQGHQCIDRRLAYQHGTQANRIAPSEAAKDDGARRSLAQEQGPKLRRKHGQSDAQKHAQGIAAALPATAATRQDAEHQLIAGAQPAPPFRAQDWTAVQDGNAGRRAGRGEPAQAQWAAHLLHDAAAQRVERIEDGQALGFHAPTRR